MIPFAPMDHLPDISIVHVSQNQTSYDRSGGNADGSGFLYADPTGKVMLDAAGPGIVRSIWVTGFAPNDRLKAYFDGEAEPRIDILMSDLFSGTYTGCNNQFRAPLVGDKLAYSGGFVCYVPLPFAKSIKISTTADRMFYNQFRYDTYPAGSGIQSWTPDQDNSAQSKAWSNVTADPKHNGAVKTKTDTVELHAGGSATLLDLAGPRSIVSFKMRIPGLDKDVLNNIRVQATWDQAKDHAIDAPLGAFFGTGAFGPASVRSLPLGYDTATNTLYMYFPMPFAARGKIALHSNRDTNTDGIWYEIRHKAFRGSLDDVGYLKAAYSVQSHEDNDHTDLIFLDVAGSGKVVGIVDSRTRHYGYLFEKPWMPAQYLEGDERIYVDGSLTPAWQGTGTEDFYNGGWYFNQGPYTRQPSGCTHKEDTTDSSTEGWFRTAAYRMLVEDAIPFRKHIRFGMEHGFGWGVPETGWRGDLAVTAETLVFYYHSPKVRMTLSDTLDVGDESSESSHEYTSQTPTWSGSLSSTYEGDDDHTTVTDKGRAHKGHSQFQMVVSPSNRGVILRRRFDYGTGNQRADVYVDGVLAGRWSVGGNNGTHRWRDTDYVISPDYTTGKRRITVKIQFVSSDADWNEYRYEAFSLE